jgi:hypothetical protein
LESEFRGNSRVWKEDEMLVGEGRRLTSVITYCSLKSSVMPEIDSPAMPFIAENRPVPVDQFTMHDDLFIYTF